MSDKPPDTLPRDFQNYLEGFFSRIHEDDYGEDFVGRVVRAMDDTSGRNVANELLAEAGLHYSAPTWKELADVRIRPAVEQKRISQAQLRDMLQEMEEHGHQHLFLFKIMKKQDHRPYLKLSRIEIALRENKAYGALNAPADPSTPQHPRLVNVRIDDGVLVYKTVETKDSFIAIKDFDLQQGRAMKLILKRPMRRIKMARLHPDGLLEVRLGMVRGRRTARVDYRAEAAKFLESYRWLVEPSLFGEVDMAKVTTNVLAAKSPHILLPQSGVKTAMGSTMITYADSRESSLTMDPASVSGINEYLSHDGSELGGSEVRWVARPEPHFPRHDVFLKVGGAINEFATRRNYRRADFDHVIGDIRRLGSF